MKWGLKWGDRIVVPRFDPEHKIVKCDGCSVRVAMGLEPACVRACNTGALKLV